MSKVRESYKGKQLHMPRGSDEILFIGIILGIAIFILIALLVATFVILHTGTKKGKERRSTSLAENPSAPIPKEQAIVSLPVSKVVIPAPGNGQEDIFKINQRARNLLSVPITMALMMALTFVLVLVNPTDKVYMDMAVEPWLWSILRIFVGIAGGGAVSVRIAHLSWRQTVLASLLTGAVAMIISRFEISPFYAGPWDFSVQGTVQFYPFLIGTLAVSAPVFLLPLCDPVLRQSGLAPSRQKVLSGAFLITLVFIPLAQIAAAVFVVFTGFLLGIGLILSLYRPTASLGAEFGGLGLMHVLTSSFVWLAYVSGSFS